MARGSDDLLGEGRGQVQAGVARALGMFAGVYRRRSGLLLRVVETLVAGMAAAAGREEEGVRRAAAQSVVRLGDEVGDVLVPWLGRLAEGVGRVVGCGVVEERAALTEMLVCVGRHAGDGEVVEQLVEGLLAGLREEWGRGEMAAVLEDVGGMLLGCLTGTLSGAQVTGSGPEQGRRVGCAQG